MISGSCSWRPWCVSRLANASKHLGLNQLTLHRNLKCVGRSCEEASDLGFLFITFWCRGNFYVGSCCFSIQIFLKRLRERKWNLARRHLSCKYVDFLCQRVGGNGEDQPNFPWFPPQKGRGFIGRVNSNENLSLKSYPGESCQFSTVLQKMVLLQKCWQECRYCF